MWRTGGGGISSELDFPNDFLTTKTVLCASGQFFLIFHAKKTPFTQNVHLIVRFVLEEVRRKCRWCGELDQLEVDLGQCRIENMKS